MFISDIRFRAALAGMALCGLLAFAGCATVGVEGESNVDKADKTAPAAAENKPEAKVSIDSVKLSGDGNRVIINTTGSVKYTVFKLNDPPRLIIDLPDVDMSRLTAPTTENNDYIKDITVQPSAEGMPIGRIIIGFRDGIEHQVRAGENMLLVSLVKNVNTPDKESASQKASGASGDEEVATPVAGAVAPAVVESAADKGEKPAAPAKVITGIATSSLGGNTIVTIAMDGAAGNYNSFVLDKPSRIVVDVWGVKNATGKGLVKSNEKYVKSARLGSYPDKVRLVIDSTEKKLPPFVVAKEGNLLVVNIGANPVQPAKPPAIAAVAAKAAEPVTTVSAEEPKPATPESATRAAAASEEGVKVTLVDFRKLNGNGRLTIIRSKKTDYNVTESPDGKTVTIDIRGAVLSDDMSRTLDAAKLKTPVAAISSYQESVAPDRDVRVLVKLTDKTKYEVIESEGTLSIEFAALVGAAAEAVATPVAAQTNVAANVESTSGEAAATDTSGKAKAYTGKKIDIDMVDANLSDIFRLMAEVSNLNIIASDDVKGSVSLRLKSIPWDQAFDIILKSKDLGVQRDGNVLRVAPLAKLRQERESALASKKAQEKLEVLDIRFVPINYAVAKDLKSHVKDVLSERGSVSSEERTNTLIVKDVKQGIADAEKVIAQLDKPIPQVQIEARIVEAEASFSRDLGIQWGLDYKISGDSATSRVVGGTTTNGQRVDTALTTNDVTVGSQGASNYAINLPAANVLGALGFLIGRSGTNPYLLDLKLSAAEKAGRLKTISRPRVTTLDNKEAKIEQGESIPYETTSSSGTTTVFVDAKLSLKVTPHITPDGSVLMKIEAKRNSLGTFKLQSGATSINTKEAATEVLVLDGETTVIGGIIVSEKNDTDNGIPYLKEIPLLGWIFKNKSVSDNQKELLIFITPTIIKTTTVVTEKAA